MVFIIPSIILLLLLINIWVFMPFFSFGLFGDDWLTIFRYFYYLEDPKHLGPYSISYFNHFTYFLNSYGPQDTITGILYKYFGEQSNIYFIVSYILRLGAGFSIYFPAFYLTKNKLAAWFAVFFFLFSAIGLEASSWVFNMPSYLAITFFNFLLYFYLKFHMEKGLKYLFFSYLFFTLTFISTPIRAHGLIPFIIYMEIIFLIFKRNWRLIKFSLIRTLGFLLIFLSIYFLGFKESISGTGAGGLSMGFNNIYQLLSGDRFDFLFYPLATLGGMIIPNSPSVLVGTALAIITLIIFFYQKSNNLLKYGLLIGLGWAIISSLYPWLQPNTSGIFSTTHRYLITSGVGISILLATIISLGRNTKNILMLLSLGGILIIMHAFATRIFLNDQYQTHNRVLVNKIWSQMPNIPQIGKTDKPLIFYFEGDQTNGDILHDSITFGFPFHMALIYNLTEENQLPLTMDSWEEVVSAVTDGKSFIKHYGKAIDPIPIENVYVFKLEGKDNLINLTDSSRQKLKEI